MLEKAKKIWKEHKKEIIFGSLLAVVGGIAINATNENKRTLCLIDGLSKVQDEYDTRNVVAIKKDMNILAKKLELTDSEWNYSAEPNIMTYEVKY